MDANAAPLHSLSLSLLRYVPPRLVSLRSKVARQSHRTTRDVGVVCHRIAQQKHANPKSGGKGQVVRLGFDNEHQFLNGLNFLLVEVTFPALLTDPCRDAVQQDMASVAVYVQRSDPAFHFALAVNTGHVRTRLLKSPGHSCGSGKYAVIIAKYSSLGAQTT